MKFMEKLKKAKKDNKGFSLVELIIVIAIMAILVGIVGTQVIPYINKSKVAKDQQVLSSVCTAAVTAYTENAETVSASTAISITDVFSDASAETDGSKSTLMAETQHLSGFDSLDEFVAALSSDGKDDITGVKVEYDFDSHKVTVSVTYSTTPKYPIDNVTGTL